MRVRVSEKKNGKRQIKWIDIVWWKKNHVENHKSKWYFKLSVAFFFLGRIYKIIIKPLEILNMLTIHSDNHNKFNSHRFSFFFFFTFFVYIYFRLSSSTLHIVLSLLCVCWLFDFPPKVISIYLTINANTIWYFLNHYSWFSCVLLSLSSHCWCWCYHWFTILLKWKFLKCIWFVPIRYCFVLYCLYNSYRPKKKKKKRVNK